MGFETHVMLFALMTLTHLSDAELVANFQDLIIEEREKLVLQLEHLVELDRRKLFFHYSSLRAYLVEEHGMEEWNAERKIRAARMLGRFPGIKEKIESGQLNLTLLEIAQGCAYREKLSDPETWDILEAISGMSCRAAMKEVACRFPHSLELPKDRIRPLNAEFSEVRFVASQELLDKLDEIRGLLAHSNPQMTLGELIDVLASEYRERHHPEAKAKRAEMRDAKRQGEGCEKILITSTGLEPKKDLEIIEKMDLEIIQSIETEMETNMETEDDKGLENRIKPTGFVKSPTAPRVTSPHETRIPSRAIVHELTKIAGYVCAYVDPVSKQTCLSRQALEIDHIQPWSEGGRTELSNLRYLCRAHHRRISFLKFGASSKYSRRSSETGLSKKEGAVISK